MSAIEQSTGPDALLDICRRLRANVEAGAPDMAEDLYPLPADYYNNLGQFETEVREIFRKVPLLVALTCDIPQAGDYLTMNITGHPIIVMRGDDGVARVFRNICRHRGTALTDKPCGNARALICPYHSWSYDRQGKLKGIPDSAVFGETGIEGLIELPADEVAGAVFCSLDENAAFSAAEWLGDMLPALEAIRLHDFYPYRQTSTLDSPNWKLAADGYLDGYHLGFLHKDTIGSKSINNRNTYDILGPHVRIGFANKGIYQVDEKPADQWVLGECMSLVHYVFPNVSISGGHHNTIQLSRLFPGPDVSESTTVQYQYFRNPVEGDLLQEAEAKRKIYEQVVRDEDCKTIFTISEALNSMASSPIVFGKNEPGNQALHRTIQDMTSN